MVLPPLGLNEAHSLSVASFIRMDLLLEKILRGGRREERFLSPSLEGTVGGVGVEGVVVRLSKGGVWASAVITSAEKHTKGLRVNLISSAHFVRGVGTAIEGNEVCTCRGYSVVLRRVWGGWVDLCSLSLEVPSFSAALPASELRRLRRSAPCPSCQEVAVGLPVVVVGYPLLGRLDCDIEDAPVLCSGHIVTVHRDKHGTPVMYQTSAAVHRGNSGGGMFCKCGHLLGLCTTNLRMLDSDVIPEVNFVLPVEASQADETCQEIAGLWGVVPDTLSIPCAYPNTSKL